MVMDNKMRQQEFSAHKLLEQTASVSAVSSDYQETKDNIKSKVLNHYLNSYNTKMETNSKGIRRKLVRRPALLVGLGALATLIVAIPLVVVLATVNSNSRKSNQELKSEIAFIEGDVMYKNAGEDWQAASDELTLDEGDSVKTSDNAKVIINLDDGSSVRLNANSQVTFKSLNADDIAISNDSGEVYARVIKADRDFKIEAGDVTYKSLGTAYKTINTEEESGVEVYHSQVSILGINSSEKLLVEQGERYYVVNTANPDLAGKVTEVNLEEVKADQFVMWNKDQDEKVNEFKGQMGVLFDLVPPELAVTSPKDGATTDDAKVTVTGTVEKGATVTINGNAVNNNDGNFSAEISLNTGKNSIKVVATDASKNSTVVNLSVKRETDDGASGSTSTQKITLSGTKVDSGVSLSWNVSGLDTSHGFKLVKSTDANPVYPGDNYQYLSNGATRKYTWSIKDGKTYHFRVCQYLENGTCGVYSNDITVKAPTSGTGAVTGISLSAYSGNKVKWTVNGYSDQGFKVVWSKNTNPTYPTRSGDKYDYIPESTATVSNTLEAFDGAGTYYVRVCEYLGGACGVYSNQITVTL